MKILFKNGRFIDAKREFIGSIFAEDGIIKKIFSNGENLNEDIYDKIVDLKGGNILPGLIDLHVHFRDPGYTYKEDIISGLKAAVKGGYTTLCAMANTNPICDNKEILKRNFEKAKKANIANFIQISAIGKDLEDKEFVDIKENLKYTPLFSNDGKTIVDDEFMKQALIKSKEYNFTVLTHCDPEVEIIKRDLDLLREVGGNLHICHISKKETLDLVKEAKDSGLKFTLEVAPHHVFSYDNDYKVAPPIGTKEDNEEIMKAIKEGYIDIHATDHAPHSKEDKEAGAPGINNIETSFQMYLHKYIEYGINIHKLCEMTSYNPSKILGVKKGLFKEGYDLDFIIVDIDKKSKIDSKEFISKSNNTPFSGDTVSGLVLATYVKGEKKYEYNG